MKKLNLYFFGEEIIHWPDACWFYGVLTLCSIITGYMALSI